MRIEYAYDIIIPLQQISCLKSEMGKQTGQQKAHDEQIDIFKHIYQCMDKINKRSIKVYESSDHQSEIVDHYRIVLALIPHTVQSCQNDDHVEHRQHTNAGLLLTADPFQRNKYFIQ